VRGRLDGVDLELLRSVVPPGRYIASCLVPPGAGAPAVPGGSADGAGSRPSWSPDPGHRWLAEALWKYWDAAIRPYWPRMCAVLEDDVSHRMNSLVDDGYYSLFRDLHPVISVEGGHLFVDKPHFDDSFHASEMILTPSVFAWPNLILQDGTAGQFGLTYAVRGIARVWEGRDAPTVTDAESLAALLGRARAAILRRTSVPMSTTQLARELQQSPASVNEHLAVLRNAGLLTSRRSGRSVLYRQTPLAEYIVSAQQDTGGALRSTAPGAAVMASPIANVHPIQ
jgi:DNA-binding transcriptional ArsR family regulator